MKPLSVLIPLTATITNEDLPKQIPSPTNSSRSTVVRSQSSSDVESTNEQISTEILQHAVGENFIKKNNENESNIEQDSQNDGTPSEKG